MPNEHGDVVYAGFLRRWAALFLDQLILTGALYFLMFVAMLVAGASSGFDLQVGHEPPPWLVAGYVAAIGLYYVAAGLYYSLMESSAAQATVGKMALGIKVVDERGARLSWPHAIARWFAAGLSYLTFYIGFLVAAFTERKQALHDLVAKTLVVDKWAYTDTPERQQRGLNGCLIVFLVFMGLMLAIAVLGILAAIAIPAYQDYTVRARAVAAVNAMRPLQAIVESRADGDDCPTNGVHGIGEAESYRSPFLDRIEVGSADGGACFVAAYLAPTAGSSEESWVLQELDMGSGRWSCSSNLPDRQLPAACR
jgi:uncharacterized RDD family membrane protein YckC/type II secretory pathway pseudopilin PulG